MNNVKRTNPLSSTAKAVLVVAAVLIGWFSHALGGWGLPAGVGAAAIVVPTLQYRSYWHRAWFWLTMLGMSIIQVPLVVLARPLMDQLKFGFNIFFVIVDVFLVAIAVNWIHPKDDQDDSAQ